MISPQIERSTAKITELDASHVAILSKSAEVAAVILEAANAVGIS